MADTGDRTTRFAESPSTTTATSSTPAPDGSTGPGDLSVEAGRKGNQRPSPHRDGSTSSPDPNGAGKVHLRRAHAGAAASGQRVRQRR